MQFMTDNKGSAFFREATLAEMGVALKEDGGTIGVFSPKKVQTNYNCITHSLIFFKNTFPFIIYILQRDFYAEFT